jgi:hypothetical protein
MEEIKMGYFFETTGYEFENEFTEKISEFSLNTWGKGAFQATTMAEDKYQGIDCYVLGVPMDVTLNFDNKIKMKNLDYRLTFLGVEVNFGIRYGNCKVKFENENNIIEFKNRKAAVAYLREFGLTDNEIESLIFEEVQEEIKQD